MLKGCEVLFDFPGEEGRRWRSLSLGHSLWLLTGRHGRSLMLVSISQFDKGDAGIDAGS